MVTEPHAGFTRNLKQGVPIISEGPYGYEHLNVAVQRRDPNSLLNWMGRIIRMRKEVPEISFGDFSFVPTKSPQVLAIHYTEQNSAVLIMHNLSAEPREVRFSLGADDEKTCALVNFLAEDHSYPAKSGKHTVLFEPYGYRWHRVCGLDYLLNRTESPS